VVLGGREPRAPLLLGQIDIGHLPSVAAAGAVDESERAGIPPDELGCVFDASFAPASPAHEPAAVSTRTAIVSAVAEAHRGSATVRSSDTGSTFVITFAARRVLLNSAVVLVSRRLQAGLLVGARLLLGR
jgi:hypothetical protein